MASSDHDQPLLGCHKSPIPICKIFILTLSLVTVLSLASLVTFRLTTNNHFAVCATASRPTSCLAVLSKEVVGAAGVLPLTRLELLRILLRRSAAEVAAASRAALLAGRRINDRRQRLALSDCVELMGLSLDQLHESSTALVTDHVKLHADVHSWLSAVLTNHVTCMDGLHGDARSAIESDVDHLIGLASATLAVVASIAPPTPLNINGSNYIEEYPSWVSSKDRRLLGASAGEIKADVVVAKDGSGKYKKVQQAVDSAPDNGKARYVIYVKKGVYKEQVEINKKKKNVMLVGDGMDSTIITGSLSNADGSTTFKSATVGKLIC